MLGLIKGDAALSLINQKLKEVLSAVLPIVILVTLTGLTIVPLGWLALGGSGWAVCSSPLV